MDVLCGRSHVNWLGKENFKMYTLDNPHPLYGKDPNILNEFGHTEYPKYVDSPTEKTTHSVTKKEIPLKVLVQNKKEEAELLGKTKGWINKKTDKTEEE